MVKSLPFVVSAACAACAAGFSPCMAEGVIPDANAVWGRFSNGFRYALYPNKTPEKQVVMRLYVGSGSLMEDETQRGLAHFLEHMAFNGTDHFPAGQMVQYFQRIGMAFGSDTNAHTSFDETVYKLNLPSADEKIVADSLLLLRDYADGMLLPEEEIERERGVILSELRARGTPEYRIAEDFYAFFFEGTRLADRMPIGLADIVQNAPRGRFADYYASKYVPERMVLVVAGDFDTQAMRAAVAKAFDSPFKGKTPDGAPAFAPLPQTEKRRARCFVEPQARGVRVSYCAARGFGGAFSNEDSVETRQRRARLSLALEALQGRLNRIAEKGDAPISDIAAYRWTLPARFGEMATVEAACDPARWREAAALVDREVRGALLNGFSPAETREAAAKLRNALKAQADAAQTRTSAEIAQRLLDDVADGETTVYPKDEYEIYAPVFDCATPEDLRAALADFWENAATALYVGGAVPLGQEAAQAALERTLEESARAPLPAPETAEEAPFAYGGWGAAGKTLSLETRADIDVTRARFANNVCLSVKPTQFEAKTVRLLVRAGHGVLAPKGGAAREELARASACRLLAELAFLKGGLEAHTYADIERFGAENRWTDFIGFKCERDAACFSAKIPVESLAFTLQTVCAYLEHAGWRESALGQAHQTLRQLYRQARQTPEGVLADEGARFLACGDPRFGMPDEATLFSLKLADVRQWLEPQLRGGFIEVSIVGDISADEAVAQVSRTLGVLPARETLAEHSERYPAHANAVPYPEGGEKTFTYKGDLPRALAVCIWPTCDGWQTDRVRALNVLGEIATDRLRLRVREQMGDTYSPHAYNLPNDVFAGRGDFRTIVMAEPSRLKAVESAVAEISAALRAEGVRDGDAFVRAKAPFAQLVDRQLQHNEYWLGSVLRRSWAHPELLERPLTIKAAYADMAPEAVDAVLQEYLVPERAIRLRIVPEKR